MNYHNMDEKAHADIPIIDPSRMRRGLCLLPENIGKWDCLFVQRTPVLLFVQPTLYFYLYKAPLYFYGQTSAK